MSLPADGHLIIVGAGLAGYHAAYGVRRHGHRGRITIFGEEIRPAYDRPALSKAYLTGAVAEEDLLLDDPQDPLEVDWVSGLGVVGLAGSRNGTEPLGVRTADGALHPADAVIITTGASACTLPAASPAAGPQEWSAAIRPYVLRNMDDALALRDTSLAGASVAVLGAGSSPWRPLRPAARRGAASVTVVAGEENPGAARLGSPVGQSIRTAHEARGVRFAPPTRARAVRSTSGAMRCCSPTTHRSRRRSSSARSAHGRAPSGCWAPG
ncbi:FAD-dependent oxidoreductase [Nesterenkonia pannonica]|uniref:FAD-dependent oxidoreductase n=1 Tax=Nesterenkonia pannonica TaxID=1548602 RepID=UPI0021647331|nr:FAD-dependent oxidoreductase [Nesterenkonia pannonica]